MKPGIDYAELQRILAKHHSINLDIKDVRKIGEKLIAIYETLLDLK